MTHIVLHVVISILALAFTHCFLQSMQNLSVSEGTDFAAICSGCVYVSEASLGSIWALGLLRGSIFGVTVSFSWHNKTWAILCLRDQILVHYVCNLDPEGDLDLIGALNLVGAEKPWVSGRC